jgi:hypothetical protein
MQKQYRRATTSLPLIPACVRQTPGFPLKLPSQENTTQPQLPGPPLYPVKPDDAKGHLADNRAKALIEFGQRRICTITPDKRSSRK